MGTINAGALSRRLALVIATLVLAMAATNVMGGGLLDGKTFVAEKDELIFVDGTFRSSECDEWGFTATPYSASAEGDAIRFTAVATSPKHGTMEWSGMVRGGQIDAKYHWEKKGWFRTKTQDKELNGILKQ